MVISLLPPDRPKGSVVGLKYAGQSDSLSTSSRQSLCSSVRSREEWSVGEEAGGEVTTGRKDSWFVAGDVVVDDVVVVAVVVDTSGPTVSDTELDSEFVDFARIFCILLLN